MDNKIIKLKMCIMVVFNSMLKRRQAIIMNFFKKRKQQRLKFLQRRIRLQRQLNGMQCQFPKQLFSVCQPRFRRFKTRSRRECHWNNLLLEENADMFFENFRMSYGSFKILCEKLRVHLKESVDVLTTPVPINKQVAICIYKVASCAEYRVVGNVFGVSKSTVHKYFHNVVDAILQTRKDFIHFPQEDAALKMATSFERVSCIPNIFGCIDGTHIPILPPSDGYRDYINRKGWPSMVLQAVVDFDYLFRDISIQFPGSAHDATVFKESGLYKKSSSIIPKAKVNNEFPLMLAGDPAYPLLPWLLKPYTGNLTSEEESFNCYLSTARIRVENAFGRLKGRWRCLAKRIDVNPKFVPQVVVACAVLHNFVEQQKEKFREQRSYTEFEPDQPNTSVSTESNVEPRDVRNNIKNYLAANYVLRTSSHI